MEIILSNVSSKPIYEQITVQIKGLSGTEHFSEDQARDRGLYAEAGKGAACQRDHDTAGI